MPWNEPGRKRGGRPGAPRRGLRPAGRAGGAEPPTTTAMPEVSLRGLRADEAEAVLIKALDDAILADLPYLRIIHGKGTGALRQLVHDLLTQDPRVERFGFARREQGGHGVTIAEFTA